MITPDTITEHYAVVTDESAGYWKRIQAAEDLRTELRAFQTALVQAARGKGKNWEDIGDWLGITKQAAQQRFRTREADQPPIVN